ncbi:MAG: metallophosphoesterase [Thalassolituus sp.]
MKTLLTLNLLMIPGIALAFSSKPSDPEPHTPETGIVSFIAIGDMGTGEQGQYLVAAAMKAVCSDLPCDFALGLGDNIYESGVDSVDDIQFDMKFEEPYANLDFPFYMTLGNHDNAWIGGDGLDNTKGEYQVDYHYAEDRPSDKWHMPARYYRFTAPLASEAPLVSFFSLDSNPLAAVSDPDPKYRQSNYYKVQEEWIEAETAATTTPWKIAFSHHPYISNGQHGNAGWYDGVPAFGYAFYDFVGDNLCGKFDVMISGHDHDLQILPPVERCEGMTQIVSGAGAKHRSIDDAERNVADYQQGDTLGFMHLTIEGDELTVRVYTVDEVSGEHSLVNTSVISR